jgi:hypothetical protein
VSGLRARLAHAGHLARRFIGSLSRRPPSAGDEAWAESLLLPVEVPLWRRMPPQDRRHAVEVTRRFLVLRPDASRAEMAGALLHDVGKVEAGLGTTGRVLATLVPARWARGSFVTYRAHEEIGARWCQQAGSEAVTVDLVAGTASGPADAAAAALRAADDV